MKLIRLKIRGGNGFGVCATREGLYNSFVLKDKCPSKEEFCKKLKDFMYEKFESQKRKFDESINELNDLQNTEPEVRSF